MSGPQWAPVADDDIIPMHEAGPATAPVAAPAVTPGAHRAWTSDEQKQIVQWIGQTDDPVELNKKVTALGGPGLANAQELIDYRKVTGNVPTVFGIPKGSDVKPDAVPEGMAEVPADAEIDYGTLSGLSPEQIRAKFESDPNAEVMRRSVEAGAGPLGMTPLEVHGFTAGLDTEVKAGLDAVGSFLKHPVDALTSRGATIADAYHAGRTEALARIDYLRSLHPKTAAAEEIGGALANPAGMEARSVKGLAAAGAAYGGISGFEDSNGTFGERVTSGAKRAAVGAVAAPIVGAALKAPGAIASGVKSVLGGSPDLARRIVSKAIRADGNTAAGVGAEMAAAHGNEVPYMIADSGDNARGLLASAVREPGPARTLARDALEERQTGLSERVTNAIQRDLGPVLNHHQVADTLMTKARNEAGPLYDRFYASDPVASPAIDALLARPSAQQALKNAYRIAAEEGRDPKALGLVMGEDGKVVLEPGSTLSAEEAATANPGRFQEVPPTDEFKELRIRPVVTKSGRKVPVRGPLDITQSIRAMGGVQDVGGDLAHIGITNAPRKMPFGSNEQFLGKLINHDNGVPLDEAARRLWERGYFPEFSQRPTVNDLIDRLHQEHIGANRFFHPDDAEEVARFESAQSQRYRADHAAGEGAPIADDLSRPTTYEDMLRDAPPTEEGRRPQTEFLHSPQTLDYIKRGMDDVVETYRDKTTGKLALDTEGRAINNTLRSYIAAVDKHFPDYAAARAAYGGPVSGIEAMNQGRKALNMTADDLEARMRDMSPFEKEMFALGHRRAMAEAVDSKGDTADVINTLAGTGKKRAMLARLHGDRQAFGRFVDTLGQEREGFRTFKRGMLGSPTALNLADDGQLKFANAAADFVTSGFSPVAAVSQAIKFGFGKVGTETKKKVAALLSETDPARFKELVGNLRAEAERRGLRDQRIGRSALAITRDALTANGQPTQYPQQ